MSDRKANLKRIASELVPVTSCVPVMNYMKSRGLGTAKLKNVKAHPSLPFYVGDKKVSEYPAMVGAFKNMKIISLWVKYISHDGDDVNEEEPIKIVPPIGPMSGGAVELYDHGDHLGFAKDVDTAIACSWMFGVPTWACCTYSLMACVNIPEGVKKVTVFSDNLEGYGSMAGAYGLGYRAQRLGLEVELKIPPTLGTTWADAYMGEGK